MFKELAGFLKTLWGNFPLSLKLLSIVFVFFFVISIIIVVSNMGDAVDEAKYMGTQIKEAMEYKDSMVIEK